MSPQDTDLIEITIQTLVAFDTLLRLLKARQEALDVYQGRLRWEERRKDCWTTYISLSNDLDDFIKQARWSPKIYQRSIAANESTTEADESTFAGTSTSAADWSPLTTRSANGLTSTSHAKMQSLKVKTQSIALQSRCRSFVDQVVPLASKQLDDLIEQRQIPEAFLDEQDQLEDLAEGIKEVEVFMIQLSVQWRKSDEIYRQLRSLHIKGKQVTAVITAAQRETPTEQKLTEYRNQTSLIKHKLGALCGEQCASTFIAKPSSSVQALIDSIQKSVPEPICKTWPDQKEHSDQVNKALAMELTAAAKHVRAACHSADKYQRGLHTFNNTNEFVLQLQQTAGALYNVAERARQGWIEESDFAELAKISPMLGVGSGRDGSAPDLTIADCLDGQKHALYVEAFPALLTQVRDFEQDADRGVHALERASHDCIREGLPHSLYRREADRALQAVKRARVEARSAIEEAATHLELLDKARAITLQLSQLQSDYKECLDAETTAILLKAKEASSSSLIQDTSSVSELHLHAVALSRRAEGMCEEARRLAKDLNAKQKSTLSGVLLDHSSAIMEIARLCQVNSNYLESMEKQRRQLMVLQEDHARLTQAAMQIKVTLEAQRERGRVPYTARRPDEDADGVPPAEGIPSSLPEKDAICKKIQDYVSATHSNVALCGPPPDNVLATLSGNQEDLVALTDLDKAARQCVNEWCLLLSALNEEIETAWQGARERQQISEKEYDNIEAQQEELATELFEPQAKEVCEGHLMDTASVPVVQAEQTTQDDLKQEVSKQGVQDGEVPKQDIIEQEVIKQEDSKQRSDPLPMPLRYTQAKVRDIEEDVFGSTPIKGTFSMPEIKKGKVPTIDVKAKVRELMSHCSSGIVEEQTYANGKVQFKTGLALPTVEQAETVTRDWKEVKLMAESVVEQGDLLPKSEADQVRMAMQLQDAKVRRFSQLASFALQHTSTEEALSRFLNILDQSGEKDLKEEVQQGLIEITKSISQATLLAEIVLTDARVRHQLSQIRHSYQDMAAMAKEACNPVEDREDQDETRSTCPSRSSSASSFPSLSGSASDAESVVGEPKQAPVSLLMAPNRTKASVYDATATPMVTRKRLQSSSSGTYATAPQSTPRQSIDRRVVSEGVTTATPSRLPIPASRSNLEMSTPKGTMPRPSSNAVGLANAATRTPLSNSSSSYGHRARSRSDSGSLQWTMLPTRSPSAVSLSNRGSTPQHRASSSSSSSKPNQYRANPKSKLDVAVGKIVNKLPMPVKITHAASASSNLVNNGNATGTRSKEQWHDESGRYWVGHPDPKLCFCRILRSRTVMVRIGGGWQELGTYILKHFSHLGDNTSLSVAASPNVSPQIDRAKMDKLPWISSTSLQTPTGKSGGVQAADVSPESAYLTPVRERDELSASFRSPSSATSSPVMLSNQFDKTNRNLEDLQGMFIRRERKTSTSRIPSSSLCKDSLKSDHHTRSTLASRNRNVSTGQRRRVESLSGGRRDENGGSSKDSQLHARVNHQARARAESISLATVRPVPPRAFINARHSPALS
jgi:hypothetical protein